MRLILMIVGLFMVSGVAFASPDRSDRLLTPHPKLEFIEPLPEPIIIDDQDLGDEEPVPICVDDMFLAFLLGVDQCEDLRI